MRVVKVLVVLVAFAPASVVFANGLIISEVVDGTLPGGQPKWVELTNCGAEPADPGQQGPRPWSGLGPWPCTQVRSDDRKHHGADREH